MRPTLSTYVFCSAVALLLLIRSCRAARDCRSDYNDLGSRTLRASLVFQGAARSRISHEQHPQLHRIEFEVLKVLKGQLDRSSKPRRILVGDFGQPDVDNCVAPDVTIDSNYVVFVDVDPSLALTSQTTEDTPPSRISANRSANSKTSGSSGSLVYHVSSFPETASGKAIKEVRSYACANCGRLPKITKQPKNTTESAERKLRLSCRAAGKPSPRITWFKDDIPLETVDKRITVKENRRDSRLQIKTLNMRDSGVYHCVARNLLGNVSSQDIWVKVKGNSPKPFSKRCADQSFCLNGGTCYEMPQLNKTKFCQCAKSFVGIRCEEKLGGRNAQMVAGKEMYRYIKRKRKRHLQHRLL